MSQQPEYHPEHNQAGVINGQTLIPLGIFASLIISIIGFVVWLGDKFENMDHRLERIEMRMMDQWSRSEQEAWALRLARDNPNIKVPDIR